MLNGKFVNKLINFLIRSLSSAIKFMLLIYLARILSIEELATFNFALLLVGFIVTFVPLERHYFSVRKYKTDAKNYNERLIYSHLAKLKINSLFLISAILIVSVIFIQLNFLYISISLLILILILSAIEIINVDYFRYLQLNGGGLFMVTQILRNIVPPIIFFLLIQATHDKYPTEIYLFISAIASFFSYFICERLILGKRNLKISIGPGFGKVLSKHLDLKSHIGFPLLILALQMLPTYLDRFLIMQSSDKSLFVNYSFYSSIGTFFLILTQSFFVQPRLIPWFENRRAGNAFMSLREISRLISLLGLIILSFYFVLIIYSDFLPPVYRLTYLHFFLFIGLLFACVNGYLSAFFYSIGLDRQSLKFEIIGFIVFLILCILILLTGEFRIVFGLHLIYGIILLIFRLNMLPKRV